MKTATLIIFAAFAIPALACTAPAKAASAPSTSTGVATSWLPDGGRYTDADVAIDGPPATSAIVRKLVQEGRLAASQQRASAARINFSRAMRLAPDDRYLLWSYGWAKLNLDQPALALAAFRRNLAQRPDLRPQWQPMALALTYTAAGDRTAALAWYRTAAASDPLRWGTDAAALRSSQRWSRHERELMRTLIAMADAATAAAVVAP